jgi:anti-sigma-K factor RskA
MNSLSRRLAPQIASQTAAAAPAAPAPQQREEPQEVQAPEHGPEESQEPQEPREPQKPEQLQAEPQTELEEEAISPAASQSLEELLGEPPPAVPQDLDETIFASNLLPPEPEAAEAEPSAEKPGLVDEQDFEADLKAVVLQDLGREHGKETGRGPTPEPFTPLKPPQPERSGDVIVLARRVRRWRGFTAAMTAIAALLALYVAVSQFAPGLIPVSRQAPPPAVTAQVAPPQPSRLVAVLQQDPTTPAFLVSIDPVSRVLTVRRVSAAPEPGRSYELWLISNKFPAPRSLGVVGGGEFTSRPLPSGFDADTIKTASYAISLEPAGGSTTGAPSGPILFKGRMVESLPGSTG